MGELDFSAGEPAIFMELKAKRGSWEKNPHVFSIAGVDFCPSIQTQFSGFTVCFLSGLARASLSAAQT